MKNNPLAHYLGALTLCIILQQTYAFMVPPHTPGAATGSSSSLSASSSKGQKTTGNADIYALARAQFMDAVEPNGKVSFKPHDLDEAQERAVYDPGDELLRALNADIAANGHELGTLPMEPDYADTVYNELELASKYDMMRRLEHDIQEEQDIVSKSAVLMKLLEDPTIETLPIVYVEDEAPIEDNINNSLDYDTNTNTNGMTKRSRYYRRYPWKRHNRNRSTYEPELRYACTPTKEDVFKLLVNLHENRNGKNGKTVNFCNRKRPAKAVFTNIRFLG